VARTWGHPKGRFVKDHVAVAPVQRSMFRVKAEGILRGPTFADRAVRLGGNENVDDMLGALDGPWVGPGKHRQHRVAIVQVPQTLQAHAFDPWIASRRAERVDPVIHCTRAGSEPRRLRRKPRDFRTQDDRQRHHHRMPSGVRWRRTGAAYYRT
jgi:hypothetical protein